MGNETELNLSLTPGVASRLARHPLLTDAKLMRQKVTNTYYDTPDRHLQRESIVVSDRQKGSTRLSSVSRVALFESRQAGHDEWSIAGAAGELDFAHVDDCSLRQWLESVRQELRPAFTTSFTRSAWLLEPREGVRIELALDRGWIEAEGRRQPICELGLKLLSGGVADLFSAAGELQTELSLHPETTSKFQRGYRVLADQSLQATKALPVATDARMTPIAAFRMVARSCVKHLQSNEQGVRESDNPEFVHQARVAIRRLRSAIRVWKPLLPKEFVAGFDPLWQTLAKQLGESRNWDVFVADTLPAIGIAFPGGCAISQLSDYARRRCAVNREAARRALKSPDYSRLLLGFTAAVLALPDREARCLESFAPQCLDKRAKRVRQLAAEAKEGNAIVRHRLRVAYKRLRYGLEFFASLFPGDSLSNYHVSASSLQELLGRMNDLAVATELIDEALPSEQGNAIRSWLAAQTGSLLPELEVSLSDFHWQAVPWRSQ